MKPDAALFDLDGTLIDSAGCIVVCTRDAFVHFGLPAPTEETIRGLMGIPIEKSFPIMAGAAAARLDPVEVIGHYRGLVYERSREMIHAFPGVEGLLRELRDARVPIAIVTSKKSHTTRHNLEHTGLAPYIDVAVCSDEVEHHKPHPQTVVVALERLGLTDAGRTTVVGDATFDIDMGHAAGAMTCAALWGAFDHDAIRACRPTHLAATVADLRRILLG